MNKRLALLIVLALIILISLPVIKILNLFFYKDIDGKVTVNLYQNVAPKIDEFIKTNHRFPNNLKEANISDTYCIGGNCN